MALVCAISGVCPEEPVFSPTGYIFEKRLIEKSLKTNEGKCPITGADLKAEDLQPIRANRIVKPRPVTATSIPGLLSLFQSEWDAVMTETYALRQHVDQVRSQLAHSLYQHDAACRVIARLIRERDAEKQKAQALQERLAATEAVQARGTAVDSAMTDDEVAQISANAKRLLAARRKREGKPPFPLETLQSFSCTASPPLHQTTLPGVKCCAADPKEKQQGDDSGPLIASGGNDHHIVLYDVREKKTRVKLTGHMRPVNRVLFHPTIDALLSASDDKTVRIWRRKERESFEHSCAHVIRRHAGEIKDMAIHAIPTYFATCAQDGSWMWQDVESGRVLRHQQDLPCNYRCIRFHPDGLILGGGGEDGKIHIWDVKCREPALMASLEAGTGRPINALAFSENGYHLAVGGDEGVVHLWDLRKSVVFQTLKPAEMSGKQPSPIYHLTYDHTGNYLACSSNVVTLFNMESKTSMKHSVTLSDHQDAVTGLAFGPLSQFLVSSSLDRTVRVWEPKEHSGVRNNVEDEDVAMKAGGD